ncbi:MAG: PAS domain S-box protein [Trueperaceae bacterium]
MNSIGVGQIGMQPPAEKENAARQGHYLLLAGILAFVSTLVLVSVGLTISLRYLRSQEVQKNLALSQVLSHAYASEIVSLLQGKRVNLESFTLALQAQLERTATVKVNLFNDQGVIVYSTNEAAIGENEYTNSNLQAALHNMVASEYETFLVEGEARKVVAIYLPLDNHQLQGAWFGSQQNVVGVLEVYSDVDTKVRVIRLTHFLLALLVTLLFVLIFGGVYRWVRRSSRALHHYQNRLERYALLVQQTPTVIMEVSPEGQLLFANPSAQKHFPELGGAGADVQHPLLATWDTLVNQLRPGLTFEREVLVGKRVYLQKINFNAQSQNYDIYAYELTQQKRSEAQLLRAQREQQALLEALPDTMMIVDATGVVQPSATSAPLNETSQVVETVLPHSDLLGLAYQDALNQQAVQQLEYRKVSSTGQSVFYEARLVPIGNERVMVLVRDVTQRHEDEVALQRISRDAQRRTQELLLLDRVRTVATQDLELETVIQKTVTLLANTFDDALTSLYVLEQGELLLKHHVGYVQVIERLKIDQGMMGRVVRTGQAVLIRTAQDDQAVRDFQGKGIQSGVYVPLLDNGQVVGLLSLESTQEGFFDEADLRLMSSLSNTLGLAVERARLYKALQGSESRYRNLIENASDIIYRTDIQGYFRYANSVVKRVLGYDNDAVLGRHYLEFVRPDHRAWVQDFYLEQFKTKTETTYLEFPVIAVDGTERWMGQNVSMVRSEGKLVGMQAVVRDISERKVMEEALLQQAEALFSVNADLEQFAFIAAHDLQEPLRKIQAFSDRLNSKYEAELGDQGRDYLQRIHNSVVRMRTLIDNLLSFARANKQQKREFVSLETVVQGVLNDLQISIEETGATVEVVDLPTLYADASQLRQVFQNLLSNALKFRKADVPPVISVTSQRRPSGHWDIAVADNGIGFEEHYKERIFGVFQRLHNRDSYEGTGIGLAIVRRIIEGHEGSVAVSSRPGEGSTFVLTLPDDVRLDVAKIYTEDERGTVLT